MVDRQPGKQVAPQAQAAIARANEKLSAANMRIATVPIDQCDFLEKNARYMPVEQFRRLVENIRRDGCLTSVPFAVKRGDRFLILSGNHRGKAAREAGLTEIPLLYTDQALTHAQEVAIQLAHNAISGRDDMAILRELYDEITDVTLKEYSGLDDVALGQLEPPDLDPLSEKGLEYRLVSIAFLPEEVDRAEAVFAKVLEQATGKSTWVNRRAEYDRLLDVLTVAKETAGVKNTATAFGLLLDLVEKHLADLPRPEPKAAKKAGKKATKSEA